MEFNEDDLKEYKKEENITGFIHPSWWNFVHNPEKCKELNKSSQDGKVASTDDWIDTWEAIQKLGGK